MLLDCDVVKRGSVNLSGSCWMMLTANSTSTRSAVQASVTYTYGRLGCVTSKPYLQQNPAQQLVLFTVNLLRMFPQQGLGKGSARGCHTR